MRELTTEELREVQVDILQYLHNICEENNLVYYLAYGTLIGAVRHKGFIPWDDDIDIYMPMEDFRKASKIINQKQNEYIFMNCEDDFDYPISFGKIMRNDTIMTVGSNSFNGIELGVNIDVFPLVKVDKEKFKKNKKKISLRCFYYRCKSLMPNKDDSFIKKILKQVIHLSMFFVNFNDNAREITYLRDQCKGNDFIVELSEYSDFKHDIKDFSKRILLEFQDKYYYSPKEYDKVLSSIYGDYMKMPNEKDRVSTHRNKSYYK